MKIILVENKKQIFQWGAFTLFFAFFWRTYDLFNHLTAYGDALEVVWGIQWYNHALTEWISPFYYPYMFHPEGWQVGILAHTPLLFALAQPFYFLGGEIFAFNAMAITSFFIAYIGGLRFFRHYSKSHIIVVCMALGFTFTTLRSSSAGGHLNFLWATSLFPWLGHQLNLWLKSEEQNGSVWNKHILLSGVCWGLMISFTLYSIFLGSVLFLFLGKRLFNWQKIVQFLAVGLTAIIVGSTSLLPYYFATRNEEINTPAFDQLVFFSESVNNFFVPSKYHTVSFYRTVAEFIDRIAGVEAQVPNMGIMTLVLVTVSFIVAIWMGTNRQKRIGHLLVFFVGMFFALGPLLKLNGEVVRLENIGWLNEQLWQLGRMLKPGVFSTEAVPPEVLKGIPLPAYLPILLIPFWEGARTASRFVAVAFLGALGIAATGMDKLPKWVSIVLMSVWLVEMLPGQTGINLPVSEELHPAHAWLTVQTLQPGEGVLDMNDQIIHSAYPLYLSWQTKLPTASATGSFRPAQNQFLFDQTWNLPTRPPDVVARMLQVYGVRYLVIHNEQERGQPIWEYVQANQAYFSPIDCFKPPADYASPWAYPICIAEVKPHATLVNAFPIYGLSTPEPWGMWSIDRQPRLNFIATAKQPHQIEAELFPNCVEGENQSLILFYREDILQELNWENCDPISFQLTIPAENVEVGFNEIRFELGYAKSPAELGTGNDPRALGVGFSRFTIRPVD